MGEERVRPPGCSPRTSLVGNDLRAVRRCGIARRDCLPWRGPYLSPVQRSVTAAVRVCRRGAFGEIALPRRRLWVRRGFGHPDVVRGPPWWGTISERSGAAVLPVEIACHGEGRISVLFSGPSLRRSVSADVALSEKSPYLGGVWVRLDLSNVPESTDSGRFNLASPHCSTWNIRFKSPPRPEIADWEEITTLPACSSILSGMMSLWWELAMLGWKRLWLPRGWAAKHCC